ncbi:glycosyltransferase involved in cell wall biosynthesis [Glaciihabitans tibetensis]|uniref:Glycosyltransferase involved in cell wall biosynthesis n=1 Tax=Glaciihabitans tibetensis TaxID=1266600 RepID=A0A2T0VFT4_9MICO|nr:glycosyltransferase family 2 protein [Glaciihabitans tibetensis]PRY68914.1 glycosyltransferase involved in cell wall biosynthesis [Glaciihabitans tibetensis]
MAVTISVALCTYNGARFLDRQFASILAGELLPTEIVVADDGSSDDTVTIVRAWLDRAQTLGVTVGFLDDGGHLGVTANFARAIAACTSEIIALADQDDLWHPSRLREVAATFEARPDLLLQHADARLIDKDDRPLGLTLFEALGVTDDDRAVINSGDGFARYLRRNLATGATVAFRRRLFEVARPLPAEWVHDEWLTIIGAAVGEVAVSDSQVIDYRQHGSNEIGVSAPTLRYKIRRMLATSPERNAALARRTAVLAERLAAMTTVSAHHRDAAATKARFESLRASLPVSRLPRLAGILAANRVGRRHFGGPGGYATLASQGRLDMVRDLLQKRA